MLQIVKKIGVIAIIAILFSLFSFSIVDVIVERPNYEDFCGIEKRPLEPIRDSSDCPSFKGPTTEQRRACNENKGIIEYSYDEFGCPVSFECNKCRGEFEAASKQHRLVGFIITSIMGIIAVIVGLYVKSEEEIVEWIFSGILIGGLISIFIGTMFYFSDMGRFVKPFILLAEMDLIIWVAVKTKKKEL